MQTAASVLAWRPTCKTSHRMLVRTGNCHILPADIYAPASTANSPCDKVSGAHGVIRLLLDLNASKRNQGLQGSVPPHLPSSSSQVSLEFPLHRGGQDQEDTSARSRPSLLSCLFLPTSLRALHPVSIAQSCCKTVQSFNLSKASIPEHAQDNQQTPN